MRKTRFAAPGDRRRVAGRDHPGLRAVVGAALSQGRHIVKFCTALWTFGALRAASAALDSLT